MFSLWLFKTQIIISSESSTISAAVSMPWPSCQEESAGLLYGAQILFHGGDLRLSTVVSFETTRSRSLSREWHEKYYNMKLCMTNCARSFLSSNLRIITCQPPAPLAPQLESSGILHTAGKERENFARKVEIKNHSEFFLDQCDFTSNLCAVRDNLLKRRDCQPWAKIKKEKLEFAVGRKYVPHRSHWEYKHWTESLA